MQHRGGSFAAGQGSGLGDLQPDRRGALYSMRIWPRRGDVTVKDLLKVGQRDGIYMETARPSRMSAAQSDQTSAYPKAEIVFDDEPEIEENEISHAPLGPAVNKDQAALATSFVDCLVRLVRAHK